MGRFRRKKVMALLDKSSRHTGTNTTHASRRPFDKGFSAGDRKLLDRYLKFYRDGCLAFQSKQNSSDISIRGSCALEESNPDNFGIKSTLVANACELPQLNLGVFGQPYLALPKEFTSKQRRAIHEMCADLGLYHIGVGASRDNRQIIISIYHDGFHRFQGFSDQCEDDSNSLALLGKLKPWVLRSQNDVNAATDSAREAIYKFIDQPGDSLRDGIDFIDFKKELSNDLSKTTPPGYNKEEWMLVDSLQRMRQCVDEITACQPSEIAFDLECYNPSKYKQTTCLLQLATDRKEYVIDTLAPGVWESVHLLSPLFADPRICKIGHSIGGLDVRCLHRDFGIFVVNAFDTYEAAQCLRLSSKGLAKVCAHYGLPNCSMYEDLKKKYQTTDWTKRPLTEPMILYGRYDVHYLIQLRKLMMRDLAKPTLWDKESSASQAQRVKMSLAAMMQRFDEDEETFDDNVDKQGVATHNKTPMCDDAPEEEPVDIAVPGEHQSLYNAADLRMDPDLMRAISRSQNRCLDLWNAKPEPALKNSEFQNILLRCKNKGMDWTSSQYELYERLAQFRESVASKEGCVGGFVCSLGLLALVAFQRPTNRLSLKRLSYRIPSLLEENENYLEEIFALVKKSRAQDGLPLLEDPALCPSFVECKFRDDLWSKQDLLAMAGVFAGMGVLWLISMNRWKR